MGQRFAYEQIYNGPTLAANDGPTIKIWLAHCWAIEKLLSGYYLIIKGVSSGRPNSRGLNSSKAVACRAEH